MPSILSLVLIAHFKGDVGIALFVPGNCDIFSGGLECLVSDTHCSKKTDNGDERECSLPPSSLPSLHLSRPVASSSRRWDWHR